MWVPEAVNPGSFRFRPYHEKDIDVVQFGRTYQLYHERIVKPLESAGRTYLFRAKPDAVLFPTRQHFIDGLARSKVSICVPRSVTHPIVAGGISTMTVRYLESMASKCLVVGVLPEEMRDLFGYVPIVEIDEDKPAEQLLEILDRYDEYVPMIERNYDEVVRSHSWRARWKQALEAVGQQAEAAIGS